MAQATHCAFLAAFLAMSGVAEAGYGFLARFNGGFVEQKLLSELTASLGHGTSHERLARLEEELRPMYLALPKKKDGGLDEGVSRYALNRYFLTRRGWHIAGIASDGEKWSANSPTKTLKSKMPAFIIELVEEHVAHRQLGLGELAVLAATVEDLVHSDALELLTMAYEAHNVSVVEPLMDEAKEELVIRTFMLFFTMPWTQEAHKNSTSLEEYLKGAPRDNPGWGDSMLWLEDVKETVRYQNRYEHNPFSKRETYFGGYPSMVKLVEQVINGFGLFQDVQCRELKNKLMDLESGERSDGRVLLTDFYSPFRKGIHDFFIERPEYLKSLGSLDDSDPTRPSVIVPNFMYGRNFCLATENSFQSFCCVDQCNVLMESLERSIAHPVASAGFVAELVAGLSSDSVPAPRNLSASLRRKLGLIAEQHGGYVPLHGRLFAQFMHHAYPNECPQPPVPGETEPALTHEDWFVHNNMSSVVPKEVMDQLADLAAQAGKAANQEDNDEEDDDEELEKNPMLWTDEEELLTSLDPWRLGSPMVERSRSPWGKVRRALRLLAMLGAAGSLVAVLLGSLRSAGFSVLQPKEACKEMGLHAI